MTNKKLVIIFGSNGQDGYYLNQLLNKSGVEIIDVSRTNASICGSVSNYTFVKNLIKENLPDYVFHFAARSSTKHDFIFENHETIATGTFNILESVKLFSPSTKVFISGSAIQFKNVGHPIDESTEFEANNPYSIARIQSVYSSRYYAKKFGLKTYVGYFFNHDSPLRSENHVNQKIVKTIQRIAAGSSEKLFLGNIEVRKEFNYAEDIVNAVWKLVNQDTVSEAVIGCGKAYSIKDWLTHCFNIKELQWEKYVEIIDDYTPEYNVLVSDPKKIIAIGWKPSTSFYELANIMMNGK